MAKTKSGNLGRLLISISIPFIAGLLGSLATTPAIPGWYASLAKPSLNPPNYIFGPVWSTLYLLMGISFYLIIKNGIDNKNREAVSIFILQVILNSLWSIAFFGLQSPLLGMLVIVPLWFLILVMILKFYRLKQTAGILNLPYLLWVSFASYLNLMIYLLNP